MFFFSEFAFVAEDAEFVDMGAESQDDLLRVERFAGVVGGTMLSAAAAFDAGEGLQGHQAGDITGGDQAEIFVAGKGRDVAEFASREKYSEGAEEQMEVFGVGDEGEEC